MELHEIEGIGPTYAATLQSHGLTTTDHLLEHGGSKAGREDLAEKSGISENLLLEWVTTPTCAGSTGLPASTPTCSRRPVSTAFPSSRSATPRT